MPNTYDLQTKRQNIKLIDQNKHVLMHNILKQYPKDIVCKAIRFYSKRYNKAV